MPIAIIIVESGAIYASSVLVLLITYLAGSNGQYPVLDVITPLVVRCDLTVRNGHSSPNELLIGSCILLDCPPNSFPLRHGGYDGNSQ